MSGQGNNLQLQHVRKLHLAGNSLYLPNAMSKGIEEWAVWEWFF
jgi:hypothetical protein